MSLYDRVACIPGGERALAVSRLRRTVLKALNAAYHSSGLGSQADLAKRLNVRRSAVNQVFRGDGNLRVNTLAEYLYEMGYELNFSLVRVGEPRAATLEDRLPVLAFASASASASLHYLSYSHQVFHLRWGASDEPMAGVASHVVVGLTARTDQSLSAPVTAASMFESIDLSNDLIDYGAES
jgi:transcriptional regulator with XRE-family HTH domain